MAIAVLINTTIAKNLKDDNEPKDIKSKNTFLIKNQKALNFAS